METEAYLGPEDKASHAYNNKRTRRTEVMFWEGGHCYVYLCYGIHQMFNIVCGPRDLPHAILIRAIEPIDGIDFMFERRLVKSQCQLTNGPGKLCQSLGVSKEDNGKILGKNQGVWLTKSIDTNIEVVETSRVGIDYAEDYITKPWRFYDKTSSYVSKT